MCDSYRREPSTIIKERRDRYAENQNGCTDKKQYKRDAEKCEEGYSWTGTVCGYRGYLLCNNSTDTRNTGKLLHVGWGCIQPDGIYDTDITDAAEV